MSCFLVPLAQAVATSVCRKHNEKKSTSIWKEKLPVLETMLWGATVVLIVDHIANGELSWRYPFFSALGKSGGFEQMLNEILTIGIPMSCALTAVWAIYVLLKNPAHKLRKTISK